MLKLADYADNLTTLCAIITIIKYFVVKFKELQHFTSPKFTDTT